MRGCACVNRTASNKSVWDYSKMKCIGHSSVAGSNTFLLLSNNSIIKLFFLCYNESEYTTLANRSGWQFLCCQTCKEIKQNTACFCLFVE